MSNCNCVGGVWLTERWLGHAVLIVEFTLFQLWLPLLSERRWRARWSSGRLCMGWGQEYTGNGDGAESKLIVVRGGAAYNQRWPRPGHVFLEHLTLAPLPRQEEGFGASGRWLRRRWRKVSVWVVVCACICSCVVYSVGHSATLSVLCTILSTGQQSSIWMLWSHCCRQRSWFRWKQERVIIRSPTAYDSRQILHVSWSPSNFFSLDCVACGASNWSM